MTTTTISTSGCPPDAPGVFPDCVTSGSGGTGTGTGSNTGATCPTTDPDFPACAVGNTPAGPAPSGSGTFVMGVNVLNQDTGRTVSAVADKNGRATLRFVFDANDVPGIYPVVVRGTRNGKPFAENELIEYVAPGGTALLTPAVRAKVLSELAVPELFPVVSDELAFTGSSNTPLAWSAAGLIVGGGFLLTANRRTRRRVRC